ncbi:GAF domain-containing sensor histidine kinase [Nocardioides sp.]|uniref:sensor histidine kinase n=1 Tax=Nocardioides sp. TaxID=35761 RepID=UPI002725C2F9|nr:GAF domain-containing sensor histidine kinase [Nocardioides sp.]MDO9455833.1 GAF domain-containing sensor histidine kinase [Nocardioides sp.]
MSTTEDRRRVRSIEQYDLLEHPPRLELLAVVELAAKICGTPMATINLITDTEQHQVAAYGFDGSICRREDSMCAAVLDEDTPLVVPDASRDPRFHDNPFVSGVIGNVRFYASHKLTTLDGVVIGTLCVFDEVPRDLDASQVEALRTLAERIVDVLELTLRSRELAASNERLTSFAGRVSHDLKTPLAGVSMSLELLRDELADRDGVEDASWLLDRAISSSERMAALIDEVLVYASLGGRMGAGPVALDSLLDQVLADLAAPLAGVAVVRDPLPVVVGDAVQLRSVLQNLLDNAAKYRHPDRPLTLAVTSRELDDRWRIEIADNGVGIPEGERERVFAPRVRLTGDDLGSGIGLDTVRRVVQAHGGSVGIVATPGGGTTVWLELAT